MNKLFDVLGIGAYCIDYLCSVDRYPLEDEKLKVENIEVQGGGNAATACVAVARLGGRVCYHGAIGKDDITDKILDGLKSEGVETKYIKCKEGNNPISFVIINKETDSRTILYRKKSIPHFTANEINPEAVYSSQVVLVDFYHEEAALEASRIAKQKGIQVVVDAEKTSSLSGQIMANASHIVASKDFASQFIKGKENIENRSLLDLFSEKTGGAYVTITLGSDGALTHVRDEARVIFQKAFSIEVADTTGAGDVFHGAYSYFLSKGYTIDDILRLAAACAALKCKKVGGRNGIPTMQELNQFLTK